ncbi:MAG: hypothetical protein JWP97_4618 [Labilithrix sp.]|nr:hypothetical protein [Labilithrix sp.]
MVYLRSVLPAMRSCRSLRSASRLAGLVLAVACATSVVGAPLERKAGACSCRAPHVSVLGPVRATDAPLNTLVRLEVPSGQAQALRLLLRTSGGAEVSATARDIESGGDVRVVELRPTAPLAPLTRYEIATVDARHVPPITVHAGFTTGTAPDTTAPTLDAVGSAVAFRNANPSSAACQVDGPWVVVDGLRATDPGRAEAKLLYEVWTPSKAGVSDPRSAPRALLEAQEGHITIGRESLCSPRAFPFPRSGVVTLGIAAVDEAGNRSAPRTLTIDLRAAKHP